METSISYAGESIKLVGCDKIKTLGRCSEKEGCLAFDWTNSGIAFNFNGTGFILSFGEFSGNDKEREPVYVRVTVDGKYKQRFAVADSREKIIIECLPDKRHKVEIIRVTEGADRILFKDIALFGDGAELRNPPANNPRKIEYIGDSITCGYGVRGTSADPSFASFQEDGEYSYAALTSKKLNAEGRYICVSGKGIVCNCNGDRSDIKATEYYEYLTRSGGICNDGWIPDVVVINIGTNDSGGPAPKKEFSAVSKDFVKKIRARYPKAHIIWMYGFMSQYYADTLRDTIRDISSFDERVHFLFVESMFGIAEETGANGHPNVRASCRASEKLTKKIRSVTGWRNSLKLDNSEE